MLNKNSNTSVLTNQDNLVERWDALDAAMLLKSARANKGKTDFVLPGLKRGRVGSLISPGGSGKSFLALEIALSISFGIDYLNFNAGRAKPLPAGSTGYLSFEDDNDDLYLRADSIIHTFKIMKEDEKRLNSVFRGGKFGKIDLMTTQAQQLLTAACKDRRLVILDTFSNIHNLDESDSSDMTTLMSVLNTIAETTNCSLMFLHHTSKGAALNGLGDVQQAARGSSVITDNIRYQSYVMTLSKQEYANYTSHEFGKITEDMRTDFVNYGISKCNHEKITMARWFHRSDNGVLVPTSVRKLPKKQKTKINEELDFSEPEPVVWKDSKAGGK